MKQTRALTDSELATILAALRYWQDEMSGQEIEGGHFEECPPLTTDEIDTLCEAINCGNTTITIEGETE